MFNCHVCSANPFDYLFRGDARSARPSTSAVPKQKKEPKKKKVVRDETAFVKRTEEEIAILISEWDKYVHPRAREFFQQPEQLTLIMRQIADGGTAGADPILGDEDVCVFWFGDITNEESEACIRLVKPGETAESVTFVNRFLAFMFATDESFEQLMQLPKQPFKMSCGNQLCIHLAHISAAI